MLDYYLDLEMFSVLSIDNIIANISYEYECVNTSAHFLRFEKEHCHKSWYFCAYLWRAVQDKNAIISASSILCKV